MQHAILAHKPYFSFGSMESFPPFPIHSVVAICDSYTHICCFPRRRPTCVLEAIQVGSDVKFLFSFIHWSIDRWEPYNYAFFCMKLDSEEKIELHTISICLNIYPQWTFLGGWKICWMRLLTECLNLAFIWRIKCKSPLVSF